MGFGTHPGAQSPITDDMWGRQQVHTWRLGEMGDVPETSTGDAGGLADTQGGGPGAQPHARERGAAWTCRGHEGQGAH